MPPEEINQTKPSEPFIKDSQKKAPSISIPAAILTGAAIVALAVIFTFRGPIQQKRAASTAQKSDVPASVDPTVVTIRQDDYVRGNKNAQIVVFEYLDSDCPYCETFHSTMREALSQYDGAIAWVVRYFPLTIHPNAYAEALALSCVGSNGGSDAFWKYLDTIINITVNPDPKNDAMLLTIAKEQGIATEPMKVCMKNPATAQKIDAHIAEAQKIGARGTPFSIAVNTKTGKQVVIPGAYPLENLKQMIDSIR